MDLLAKGRTQMTLTPVTAPANIVPGPEQGQWTYEDYAAISADGKHYEVVNGVLFMSPSPDQKHQDTAGAIFAYLWNHVNLGMIGRVYGAPFDVELASHTICQPDVVVILNANMSKISDKRIIGAPDLVVEVASPSTATYDRREKLDAYALSGVTEYWIAEPTSYTIEILTREVNTFSSQGIFEGKTTLTSKVVPNFPILVEQLFAYVQR
jgi:Uma2 family endonuclease